MLCPRVIGRDSTLAYLSAALDSAAAGRGRATFLVGEPGVGKSKLAAEVVSDATRRGMTVLFGRAGMTSTSVPYQPLRAALLSGFRSKEWTTVPEIYKLRPGLATLLPGFVEGTPASPSAVLLGETVLRLAGVVGGHRGTVLALDDLHWADADTLAIVEYLADNATAAPLVVLGMLRPEGTALLLADALDRRGAAVVQTLRPLSPVEVEEMAAACLGVDRAAVPDSVTAILRARAEGLPFLVEELLAGLANQGALTQSGSSWELSGDPRIEVPVSFGQTVRDRLDELGSDGTRVIEAAAVLGRDFDWTLLAAVADVEEAEVLDALGRAIELQLIEEADGNRFRFRHVLTVDAVLDSMLAPRRARLAARGLAELGEGIASMASDRVELAAHLAVH